MNNVEPFAEEYSNVNCLYLLITMSNACAGSATNFLFFFLLFYVILLYETYFELCSQQDERAHSEV